MAAYLSDTESVLDRERTGLETEVHESEAFTKWADLMERRMPNTIHDLQTTLNDLEQGIDLFKAAGLYKHEAQLDLTMKHYEIRNRIELLQDSLSKK